MDFVTVGDIAKKLDVDRDAVSYAIRKIKIQPVGRAGIVRLFPGSTLGNVKKFINSKRRRKELRGNPCHTGNFGKGGSG